MAQEYAITIEQGASFALNLAVKLDGALVNYSSGYTAKAQGRESYDSAATLFSTAEANCAIALSSTSPNVALTMTPAYTAALSAPASGVYDIEITKTSDSSVVRLIEGSFTVTPEVTKI